MHLPIMYMWWVYHSKIIFIKWCILFLSTIFFHELVCYETGFRGFFFVKIKLKFWRKQNLFIIGFWGNTSLLSTNKVHEKTIQEPNVQTLICSHNFETRPGLAGRPGAGTRPGWKKNRKRKNLATRQNSVGTRWLLFFY